MSRRSSRARRLILGAVVVVCACAATPAIALKAMTPPQVFPMHVQMSISYRVVGSVTRIRGIAMSGLPSGWNATVRCLGNGCFSHALHHPWPQDLRILRARTFYAGQKLIIDFNRPYFKTATFVLKMRYNNDPQLTLYRPRPRHRSPSRGSS